VKNKDFVAFILTHGRPDNLKTLKSLKKSGYTGPLYIIVDNEDKTVDAYVKKYGDKVKVFDKKAMADKVDEGNNFDDRRVIVHARNYCFELAKELGFKYFIQLDDDYGSFLFRYSEGGRTIKDIDRVFDSLLDFYKSIPALSIAFSQGGDHIGGFSGTKLKRKCMNSFIYSVDREFQFVGAINEDVNTYTTLGSRGGLFLTFTSLQLNQEQTQTNKSGMADIYKKFGTYFKAFTSTMMYPSGVKVSMMNTTNSRIHHLIKWGNTVPMIIDERFKK